MPASKKIYLLEMERNWDSPSGYSHSLWFILLIFLLCVYLLSCSVVSDSLQPRGIYQAPLSKRFFQARILEWVAIPFCRGSSWSKDWPQSPALQADSLLFEPPGKPHFSANASQTWQAPRATLVSLSSLFHPWGFLSSADLDLVL